MDRREEIDLSLSFDVNVEILRFPLLPFTGQIVLANMFIQKCAVEVFWTIVAAT